ncbi:MAG: MarR family transcriptional regulator [Pseudonocardiaceae bacterium]
MLRAVRAVGSLTQAEIVRSTGLSAATVSTIVRELQASALVAVTPTAKGRRACRCPSSVAWRSASSG